MVANSSIISSYGSSTAQATIELASKLGEFQESQAELRRGLIGTVELFQARNAEVGLFSSRHKTFPLDAYLFALLSQALTSQLAILNQFLTTVSSSGESLGKIMDGSIEERAAFVSVVHQARSAIHESLSQWSERFKTEVCSTTDALMIKADDSLVAVSLAHLLVLLVLS